MDIEQIFALFIKKLCRFKRIFSWSILNHSRENFLLNEAQLSLAVLKDSYLIYLLHYNACKSNFTHIFRGNRERYCFLQPLCCFCYIAILLVTLQNKTKKHQKHVVGDYSVVLPTIMKNQEILLLKYPSKRLGLPVQVEALSPVRTTMFRLLSMRINSHQSTKQGA